MTEGGIEYNLVLVAAAFGVTAIGAGKWSLDHALGLHVAGVGWAVGELAVGLVGALLTLAIGRSAVRGTVAGRQAQGGV
jgi:hypothetical protein